MTADGAKLALYALGQRGYKSCNFIHDEILVLLKEDEYLTNNVNRIQYIMTREMRKVIKHVLVKTEAAVMRSWTKKAKGVYGPDGKIIVWEDYIDKKNKN